MWITLWVSVAHATPTLPIARANDSLRERRYGDVREGPPPWPVRRAASGPVRAWTFPDGTVEHYERLDRRRIAERVRYDALGDKVSTVRFDEERPTEVLVGSTTVLVRSWEAHRVGDAWLRLPDGATPVDDGVQWGRDELRVAATWAPGSVDVFSDAFRDELAATCGCVLIDRWATWLQGARGVVYRLRFSDLGSPAEGRVVAVARPSGTLLIASSSPPGQSSAVAEAAAALVEWTP